MKFDADPAGKEVLKFVPFDHPSSDEKWDERDPNFVWLDTPHGLIKYKVLDPNILGDRIDVRHEATGDVYHVNRERLAQARPKEI